MVCKSKPRVVQVESDLSTAHVKLTNTSLNIEFGQRGKFIWDFMNIWVLKVVLKVVFSSSNHLWAFLKFFGSSPGSLLLWTLNSPPWLVSTASTRQAACGRGHSARSGAGGIRGTLTRSGIPEPPALAPWNRWPSLTCLEKPRTDSSTDKAARRR